MTSSCVTWYCFKGALFKAVCLLNQKFDGGKTWCIVSQGQEFLELEITS